MRLAIVGGSAQSTPNLFLRKDLQLPDLSVVLIGRSPVHLRCVRRAIRIVSGGIIDPKWQTAESINDLAPVLTGSDVVLVQARYGGYEARIFDETFPHEYGICGDEGLGPGGLASAWRAWPHLEDLLTAIRANCSGATVILLSSPLGVLSRAALTEFQDLRVFAVCELPWSTLQLVCKTLRVEVSAVEFAYAGVNHLGWLHHIRLGGRDLVSEFAETRNQKSHFPSGALIEHSSGIPLSYLRLHYNRAEVLREQTRAPLPRGRALQMIRTHAMKAFAEGNQSDIVDALRRRPAPWYEEGVAPLILAFRSRRSDKVVHFLTTFNQGYIPSIRNDDVVEIPHVVIDGKLSRRGEGLPPSNHILERLRSYVDYERKATAAVVARDPALVEEALFSHPWVGNANLARGLADKVVCGVAKFGCFEHAG